MTLEHAYAEALIRAVENGVDEKTAVQRLVEVLKARGMEALVPRVVNALREAAARKKASQLVTLTVARKADAEKALKAAEAHLDSLGAQKEDVHVTVDDSIVGGHVLSGRGKRIDNSYKRELVTMYRHMVHAIQY